MYCENHNLTHTYRNLDVYIFMRLMWNPERSVEKELEEYFRLYYGPAADSVKKLYLLFENNWIKIDRMVCSDQKTQSSRIGMVRENKDFFQQQVWGKIYTPEEMKKVDSIMQEIHRLTPAGSVYAKRAGLLQKYLIEMMKNERSEVMDKEERRQALKLSAAFSAAKDFPSDQEWGNAQEYKLVSAQRLDPELKAPGSFRLLASNDMLFIRADLKEPKMADSKTSRTHKNGNQDIWKDNCIELFFHAEKSKKFWQIIVNDNNVWSSQTRGRVLNRWEQMKGLRVKTRRKADSWTAEIAIPIRELKTDKADLRFNFTRERNVNGQKTEFSTWSPLAMLGNWHSADNYGTIIFKQETP